MFQRGLLVMKGFTYAKLLMVNGIVGFIYPTIPTTDSLIFFVRITKV
jgi:hypothetical protein